MVKTLTILKKILIFIWKIFKHVFLLPLYCSLPDKYNGITYNELLNGHENKDDDEIDAETKES